MHGSDFSANIPTTFPTYVLRIKFVSPEIQEAEFSQHSLKHLYPMRSNYRMKSHFGPPVLGGDRISTTSGTKFPGALQLLK